MQDYDKRTALHLAAAMGHVNMVEFLLQANAEVNCTDRMGFSPLVCFLQCDRSTRVNKEAQREENTRKQQERGEERVVAENEHSISSNLLQNFDDYDVDVKEEKEQQY